MQTSVKYTGDGERRSFKIGFPWGVASDIGVRVRSANGENDRELAKSEYRIVSDCVVYDLAKNDELEIYLASPLGRALLLQEDRVLAAEKAGISAENSLWYAQGAASLAEEAARQSLREVERLPELVAESREEIGKLVDSAVQSGCQGINDICESGRRNAREAINDALKAALLPGIYAVNSVEAIPKNRPGFYVVLEDCEGNEVSVHNFTPVVYENGRWLPCDHHHEEPEAKSAGPFKGTLYHVCRDGRYDKVYLETTTEQVKDADGKSLADILADYLTAIDNATANNVNGLEQKLRIDALESWQNIAEPWRQTANGNIASLLTWKEYADARLYVPDDITVKATSDKRLYVSLKSGGGLGNDSSGIYVIMSQLIQAGGGLAYDVNGKAFVDFSTMPTDKFEALLKSLRLQKWLTANTNFYVDKNHAAAADTLDEGRGLSPAKPFRTIQACVNYICDNFNFSTYNVYIHISGDVYEESVHVFDYNSSGGKLHLIGVDTGEEPLTTTLKTSNSTCLQITSKEVRAYNIKFQKEYQSSTSAYAMGIHVEENGSLILERFELVCNFGNDVAANKGFRPIVADGYMQLQNTSLYTNGPSKITMNNYTQGMDALIRVGTKLGMWCANAEWPNIICSGGCSVFIRITGYFGRNTSCSRVLGFSGTMTGKRYVVESGGHCNTQNAGPDYFPGNSAGSVDASTYSWYK